MVEQFTASNPLVAAAGPVLTLVTVLQNSASQPDVEKLRNRCAQEVRAFEDRAAQLQVSRGTIRMARYALAATIDDVAQNTPWGGQNVWAARSIVSTFDREAIGGERFYDVLDHVHRDPAGNLWLLELLYLCLSLGFEGRLRVERGGQEELNRIRDGLFRTIRNHRSSYKADLAPRWRGLEVGFRPLRQRLPLWIVGAVTAGLLAVTYIAVSYRLSAESDGALDALARVPGIDAAVGHAVTEPAPPAPEPGALDVLRTFLEPEIKAGLVQVLAEGQIVVVRLRAAGMFASGSADLSEQARNTLERVAMALAKETGPITVVGHTDNIPIRSPRFPSNWELSKARAQSAADLIARNLAHPNRINVEGRGASEPIAPNDTAEGRARNRRIAVRLRPDRRLRAGDAVVDSTENR
jgi:type VI secretion system protein ImpK